MQNLLEILIFTLRNFTKLPILRYLGIFNVLHIWHIRAIPTYRVYRLYDNLGWCKTWTLDSGLDSWTGLWTEIWTRFWTDVQAQGNDDHFQETMDRSRQAQYAGIALGVIGGFVMPA